MHLLECSISKIQQKCHPLKKFKIFDRFTRVIRPYTISIYLPYQVLFFWKGSQSVHGVKSSQWYRLWISVPHLSNSATFSLPVVPSLNFGCPSHFSCSLDMETVWAQSALQMAYRCYSRDSHELIAHGINEGELTIRGKKVPGPPGYFLIQ
jgi:hypothetical protein